MISKTRVTHCVHNVCTDVGTFRALRVFESETWSPRLKAYSITSARYEAYTTLSIELCPTHIRKIQYRIYLCLLMF